MRIEKFGERIRRTKVPSFITDKYAFSSGYLEAALKHARLTIFKMQHANNQDEAKHIAKSYWHGGIV